ncbi:MAG: hypothetical protein EON54_28005 [Alcaligenaceae bacterium]|nr:MAG: hypothetical protein EON54_28005 [Alcaligenaceae bacterium]
MIFYLGHMEFAPAVKDQPFLAVEDWRLFHVPEEQAVYLLLRHRRMGSTRSKIRMTSAIVGTDPLRRIVRTFSGRLYELSLPPCADPTVQSAFLTYLQMQGLAAYEDVSSMLWAQLACTVH